MIGSTMVGNMIGNTGLGNSDKTLAYAIIPRYMSDAEVKCIIDNPWQIFAPQTRRRLISVGVGGSSTDLTVQEATHAHLADSPTFSMATYLAVAESLHSHAADNLTLGTTGAASLIVQEANHTHIADGIGLTTQWLLTVAEALHAHAADSLTLDTSNATALTVQEATHGHSTDGISMSLDTWLFIVAAAHAHTADAPMLSASTALQIAEALHAQYADVAVLSLPGETSLSLGDIAAIAAAVLAALNATTIPVNVAKVNDVTIIGNGVSPTWGPA